MRFLFLPCTALALLFLSCQNIRSQRSEANESPEVLVRNAPLHQTRWVPREVGGRPVAIPEGTSEPYLLISSGETAEGNGGCNRFQSSINSREEGELAFSSLMSTRMACPALPTEAAFTKALEQTRAYRITGNTLWLYDAGASLLVRLEAVQAK